MRTSASTHPMAQQQDVLLVFGGEDCGTVMAMVVIWGITQRHGRRCCCCCRAGVGRTVGDDGDGEGWDTDEEEDEAKELGRQKSLTRRRGDDDDISSSPSFV